MMMMTSQLLVKVAVPYIGNPSNNFWASSTSNFRKCQGPGAILEIYANCIKKIIIIIIWYFEKNDPVLYSTNGIPTYRTTLV